MSANTVSPSTTRVAEFLDRRAEIRRDLHIPTTPTLIHPTAAQPARPKLRHAVDRTVGIAASAAGVGFLLGVVATWLSTQ